MTMLSSTDGDESAVHDQGVDEPGAEASLISLLPLQFDEDTVFGAFETWASSRGITLYPAQEEAVIEIVSGANVILSTPTGTGKSLVAIGAHAEPSCGVSAAITRRRSRPWSLRSSSPWSTSSVRPMWAWSRETPR